jgi:peptide/nickel transport system ATP-binding protein
MAFATLPTRGFVMNEAQEHPLAVDGLTTSFRVEGRWYDAIRDVSFSVARNETLALVGESGCGKSITALSIMGLVPKANGRITAGRVLLDGRDLVPLDETQMEKIRGNAIAMIFQEPMTSLNPVLPIGFQVAEALRYHTALTGEAARARALALLEHVKIPSATRRFDDYPHQISGGMRQRVMIAIALACSPQIILADEPTTALDVTIQAQVLALLAELKAETGMAMIFITHNLGVVASIADRVAVMYAGDLIEIAPVGALFERPTHPYTEALLSSIPRVDRNAGDLKPIAGQVPPITAMPFGCRYADRCPLRVTRCAEMPPLVALGGDPDHQVRCWVRAADESARA